MQKKISKSRKIEIEKINFLKKETPTGIRVEINAEHNYRIWVLHRGEFIFYQDGDKATICELDPYNYIIPEKSIYLWDNGEKISDEEKNTIKTRLSKYFLKYQDARKIIFYK